MSNFTGIHLAILLLAHQIAKSNDQTDFAASSKIIFFLLEMIHYIIDY